MEGRDRVENGRERSGGEWKGEIGVYRGGRMEGRGWCVVIGMGRWKGEIGCGNRGGRMKGKHGVVE